MAIYSTIFLSKPDALVGGFPGWRLPLPQPVWREFTNPFSGEVQKIETRAPEWLEEDDEAFEREYEAVAIEGSYEDYLESRLPPFIRACPRFATKRLSAEVQLTELARAMAAVSEFECPLYGPPSFAAELRQVPSALVSKLAGLDPRELEAIASRWATQMSTPERTHSVTGEKLSDGWSAIFALETLKPIAALARKAADGQKMYLLVEA